MRRYGPYLIFLLALCLYLPELEALEGSEPQNTSGCLGCHGNLTGRPYLHPEQYVKSVHGALSCIACHSPAFVSSMDDIHRKSLETPASPQASPPEALRRKSLFPDALYACAGCHQEVFADYRQSVHGKAVLDHGNQDAAYCTDCHAPIHYVKPGNEVSSSVARSNLIQTCSRCHENRVIASRYNLNVYVVQSYKAHFHGKKYALGGQNTPTCADCHGHHSIRRVTDPEATVSGQNKVKLCARCHPGATPEFARSFTHTPLDTKSNPIAFQVRRVLVVLLLVFAALLGLHLLLDIASQFHGLKTKPQLPHAGKGVPWSVYSRLPKKLERLDLHLRIQHAVLFVAVFYLGASGMALKFPDMGFSRAWLQLWGGVDNAGHLHRFAALILIIDALYHIFYLAWLWFRGTLGSTMLPSLRDARHLLQNIQYLMGIRRENPYFGKFTYIQKLDYWVVVLVVLVMIVTGLMYWFPTVTARLLPPDTSQWIWGVAYVVHSTEALLILFFAFVWHFYHVHLTSRVFPMSWIWITGKIDLEDLVEEHPEEFDALVEAEIQKMEALAEEKKTPSSS